MIEGSAYIENIRSLVQLLLIELLGSSIGRSISKCSLTAFDHRTEVYEFKSIVVSFDSREDILIDIFEKLDYQFVDDFLMKKEFKSLV